MDIAQRLAAVSAAVGQAAIRAGRAPAGVGLVAISKSQPASAIPPNPQPTLRRKERRLIGNGCTVIVSIQVREFVQVQQRPAQLG